MSRRRISPRLALVFGAEEVGGAEAYVRTIAAAAAARGWAATAAFPATPATQGLTAELGAAGITTRPLAIGSSVGVAPGAVPAARHALRELARTIRVLAAIRPTTILVNLPHPDQSPGAVLAAALYPARSTAVVHLVPDPISLSPDRRKLYGLARCLGQRWVAVSEDSADRLAGLLAWPPAAIVRIPNGIEISRYEASDRGAVRARVRAELGLDADTPLLLSVGRLSRQKGPDVLIAAIPPVAAAYPAARWLWVGEGGDRATLERALEVAGMRDRVLMPGSRDDVPQLLQAADVFVMPSRFEGMPFALLEAMAAGVPVIASDLPAFREVIVDGAHGDLVASEDPAGLSAAMERALGSRARGARLAVSAGRRVRERHDRAAMIERTLAELDPQAAR